MNDFFVYSRTMQKRLDYDMMTIGRIRPLEIRMYIVVRMDDFAPLPSPFDIFVYDLIIRPLHKKVHVRFRTRSFCQSKVSWGVHILEQYSRVWNEPEKLKTCKVVVFTAPLPPHRANVIDEFIFETLKWPCKVKSGSFLGQTRQRNESNLYRCLFLNYI